MVRRGIALTLLAYLIFALVDTTTKWLLSIGLMALQLAFMRYAVHFLITSVDIRRAVSRSAPMSARLWALTVFRSYWLVSSTVVNFYVLAHLPLAVSSSIFFFSPIIVCAVSWFVLGERIGLLQLGAILAGFAGVLVIIRPFGAEVNWYAVLMLYPASGMAIYSVMSRVLAGRVSPGRMQYTTGVLGTVVLLPLAVTNWSAPPDALSWVLLCLIGAFAWAGHEALTRAHGLAQASTLTPYGYSFILYVTFGGWLLFGDVPDLWTALGSLLVITAGLVIWRAQTR